MKIENLRSQKRGSFARLVATLIWEERDRPPQEIYIETPQEFAQDLSCNPHAFLIAGALPAMYYGEHRVAINAEICPELKDGLLTVMHWLHHWFKDRYQPIQIEAKTRANLSNPRTPDRKGLFFRRNRRLGKFEG